jgi:hypothetical protein
LLERERLSAVPFSPSKTLTTLPFRLSKAFDDLRGDAPGRLYDAVQKASPDYRLPLLERAPCGVSTTTTLTGPDCITADD